MKLEKWAHIAEIAGSIAVVATLIVLVLEVRSNTGAIRAASYQDALELIIGQNNLIGANPDLARIVVTGSFNGDVESLTETEKFQLERATSSMFQIYEIAFLSWDDGFMNDSEWPRWQLQLCMTFTRYLAIDWDEFIFRQVNPRFAKYLAGCPHD